MHVKTWLGATCAFALIGCFGDSDKDGDGVTGTSTTMAAEALTKAVQFSGGKLVDGLMPKADSTDVSLLPTENGPIVPGGDSLMGFDINPGDAAFTSALIQFKGASGHFEVESDAFMTDAADGGTPDGGSIGILHVELGYSIDDMVCEKLCDQKYEISVTHSLKLKNGDVVKHSVGSVTLDCSKKGDHKLCASEGDDNGGVKPGEMASSAISKVVKTYYALQQELCKCTGAVTDGCSATEGAVDCTIGVFDEHEDEIGDTKISCMQSFLDEQLDCIEAAKCDLTALSNCEFVGGSTSDGTDTSGGDGDGLEKACGALPEAVDVGVSTCNATMACIDDGTAVPAESICDGIDDCNDGSDEMNCGGEVIDQFRCQSGEILTADKLCDGTMDCEDNGDETIAGESATGVCIPCGVDNTDVYSVYGHCDGKMQCSDGIDEMGCEFPCFDGDGTAPIKAVCDGKMDCADNSDEESCSGTGMFPCGDGNNVPVESFCNGTMECSNGADEMGCPAMRDASPAP